MKLGVLALGWLAAAALLLGCSGSTHTNPPGAAAGFTGGEAGAPDVAGGGAAGESGVGCRVDADCSVGVCDSVHGVCVECRLDATCGDGKRCDDSGRCVSAQPCTPGTFSCDGQVLDKCSASGALEFFRQCQKSEFCDERRAQCEPQVCAPGEASCSGSTIQICNDDGSDYTPKKICSLSQVCRDGACLDIGCVPNTSFCSEGNAWTCGADGTTSALSEHCAANEFCLEKDHSARCSPTACVAGDALCAGNFATTCQADGSGPKPGGDDCSKANQVCYSGQCRDPLCTPGFKLCDSNKLYLCSDAGTAETLITDCGDKNTCDAATGACVPRICEPGKLSCDSTRVVTCNPGGTGWLQSGPDCAATHGLCSAGTCNPIICSPASQSCVNNSVSICNADGTAFTSSSSCGQSSYCYQSYSNYAYCGQYYCQPNSAGCNGNLLTTCNAAGTAWVAGGTDCSLSNSVCANAQCKPKVCTPATLFCSNNNVQQCDYQGLSSYPYSVCGYATYCKAQGTSATCAPTACQPGSDGCASEKFGTCGADGLSVTNAKDCAASSQVCTPQGCANSETDSVGGSSQVTAYNYYNLIGDMVDVLSPRKLTMIDVYLTLPANRTLTWAIYQKDFVNGTTSYDLKFQKTTTGTDSGFQSSGAISFQLTAGATYAIGVSVTGGSFAYYYDAAAIAPVYGFGSVSGGFAGQFGASFSYVYPSLSTLYYERLYTTLP